MSSKSLTRALALSSSALALSLTMTGQSVAQQQGDVQIRPAAQSVVDSLDSLEQLLLAPPEEANRLNFYVTPQYRRDRFDAYSEQADIFDENGDPLGPDFPLDLEAPDFNTDTTGISIGADYLFDSKWLIGGQLSYSHTDFDYNFQSEGNFTGALSAAAVNAQLLFGDPTDREFDEYGLSFSTGYIADPWTALLTIGYSRRNIETETRKVGIRSNRTADGGFEGLELHNLEADFNSDVYSVDLGGSYRLRSGSMSLQPFASIGYQIEDVEGYTEELVSKRTRLQNEGSTSLDSDQFGDEFFAIDRDLSAIQNEGGLIFNDASAQVDDQTIRSIPARVGVLFSTPLTSQAASESSSASVWRLRTGVSFTHDFSDQERNIRSLRQDSGESAIYEERNRNRNFFSLTAALGYDFSVVNGSLNYQRDIGLDERRSADVLSLQVRVPF